MKVVKHMFLVAAVCVFAHACGSKDYEEDSQRTKIESYLKGIGAEYTIHSGAYRYIYYTDNRSAEAALGDSIYLYLSGYVFLSKPENIFTTNIVEDADAAGVEMAMLSFSPRGAVVGDGSLISGLQQALPGVRQGDSLFVFMASDLAYDDKAIGIVPEGSSVAFKVVVDKIVK